MRVRLFACALGCAVAAPFLFSGCAEVNTGHQTDLAKLPPPASESYKQKSKSPASIKRNEQLARQLAKRSSPPVVHQ